MNELTIEQKLQIIEDEIRQEEADKISTKRAKEAVINAAYDHRVAEQKERIINAHRGIY